jgi:hypothetical protein
VLTRGALDDGRYYNNLIGEYDMKVLKMDVGKKPHWLKHDSTGLYRKLLWTADISKAAEISRLEAVEIAAYNKARVTL